MRPRCAALVAFALLAFPVCAQDPPNCTRYTVIAGVVDKAGQPVSTLGPEHFAGEFRGRPVQIREAAFELQPPRVVVALDTSGSMSSRTRWLTAMGVVEHYLLASSQTSVALIAFGDETRQIFSFDTARATALARFFDLKQGSKPEFRPRGTTALWDALWAAADLLRPGRVGDAIFVVTDGWDTRSERKSVHVERMLVERNIRVFAAALPPPSTYNRDFLRRLRLHGALLDVARSTGGELLNIEETEGKLPVASQDATSLRKLYNMIHTFYRLELELPIPVDKPRKWKLRLQLPPGTHSKDSRLVFQPALVPCISAR